MPAASTQLSALTNDQIDLVFPLVREADRQLSLESWRHFARPRVIGNSGEQPLPGILLAARNSRIRGLAAYDVAGDTGTDRVLTARHTVIIDRTRERHLALDLLGGLLRIAETARCRRLRVELPQSSRWLQTRWSDPGGRVFRLPVEVSTAPPPMPPPACSPDIVHFRPRAQS